MPKMRYWDGSQWIELDSKNSDNTSAVQSVPFYTGATAPTLTTRLNMNGYFYATRVYNAVYNDYAEYFEKTKEAEPGDIIVLKNSRDKEEYTVSTIDKDPCVIGVVSDSYAHCIGGKGDGHDEDNYYPIGLTGRVKVKIKGCAKPGDLIVTSNILGVGRVLKKDEVDYLGCIVGKVLTYKDSDDIGLVKILITMG